MKRSFATVGAAAAVVLGVALVPSARSAAVSALSVFRVQQAKTIDITIADITQFGANAETLRENLAPFRAGLPQAPDPTPVAIASPDEFTAFGVTLPADFLAADPEFSRLDQTTRTVPVAAARANPILAAIGTDVAFDPQDDADLTVTTPPVFRAVAEANTVTVTGGPEIDAPPGFQDTLRSVLDTPFPWLSEHLRTQLQAIDLDARDVYLPVIVGFGRAADIGGRTGYLYTAGDLASVIESLPAATFPQAGALAERAAAEPDTTVLVWVEGGAIVAVTGN
ncbi:MAG: hypothetical protein LBT54_01005, partial [Bifidobacteriaceae bacterium]|nr:hypothetical protein [Bifidobacteriaceae bacterium]